jgi:branched-chain amino acid transport system ATP-binding protein
MLDEPAAGLNEAETDALVTSIKTIRTTLGCGVVVIEHDMRFVMGISDRLQVLNFGQVLRIGSIADVQTDPAVVAAYLGDGAIADQWWRETADAI